MQLVPEKRRKIYVWTSGVGPKRRIFYFISFSPTSRKSFQLTSCEEGGEEEEEEKRKGSGEEGGETGRLLILNYHLRGKGNMGGGEGGNMSSQQNHCSLEAMAAAADRMLRVY